MQLPDRITGGVIAALGACAAYGGSLLPPVPGQDVGPNVFPIVVGFGLILCGILVALGIGHSFEDEAEVDFLEHGGEAQTMQPGRSPWFGLRALIPPAVLFFYAVSVDAIGFVPAGAIVIFIAAMALGARLKLAVPLALVGPVFVHLIFYKLLRVPLPSGFLPMPW
jgi:putative tricarboxylic transport membrane protein